MTKGVRRAYAARYSEMQNVGRAKYVVRFHDGTKKHRDGSDFYDIRIFRNAKHLRRFVGALKAAGFTEE